MKTLVQTTLWCPKDSEKRKEYILSNLNQFDYSGKDYTMLIIINEYCDEVKEFLSFSGAEYIIYLENRGWAYARNQGMKFAKENSFDYLIQVDCDVEILQEDWVQMCTKALEVMPYFQCRVSEPQYAKGGKIRKFGFTWELYDEFLGNINCFKVSELAQLGGYNFLDCPLLWGFSDPLLGRQIRALGTYDWCAPFYPSLVISQGSTHDIEYQKKLKPIKDTITSGYTHRFWELSNDILSGRDFHYFDIETEFPNEV